MGIANTTVVVIALTAGLSCKPRQDSALNEAIAKEEIVKLNKMEVDQTTFATMPRAGVAKVAAWPGYYWPTSKGGIDARLFGEIPHSPQSLQS